MLEHNNNLDERLIECFSLVFPGRDAATIREMDADGTEAWDSLSSLSLVTVIEEEFEVTLGDSQIARMTSFVAARNELLNAG